MTDHEQAEGIGSESLPTPEECREAIMEGRESTEPAGEVQRLEWFSDGMRAHSLGSFMLFARHMAIRLRLERERDEALAALDQSDPAPEELALRNLASRCESEAIKANVVLDEDIDQADYQAGRRTAFNTVERWINELLSGGDER